MKNQINSIWTGHKIELALCILGVCVGIVLIVFSYPAFLSPSDTIQSITLILLVVVTISYAKSTHKIHNVALIAEKNAVAPLIKLKLNPVTTSLYILQVAYENIGRGPALNLKIWLDVDGELFSYLKSDIEKSKSYHTAVGVGESEIHNWIGDGNSTPPRYLPDANSGFDIVAEYSDVFGQDFESRLAIINQYDQEFCYGVSK